MWPSGAAWTARPSAVSRTACMSTRPSMTPLPLRRSIGRGKIAFSIRVRNAPVNPNGRSRSPDNRCTTGGDSPPKRATPDSLPRGGYWNRIEHVRVLDLRTAIAPLSTASAARRLRVFPGTPPARCVRRGRGGKNQAAPHAVIEPKAGQGFAAGRPWHFDRVRPGWRCSRELRSGDVNGLGDQRGLPRGRARTRSRPWRRAEAAQAAAGTGVVASSHRPTARARCPAAASRAQAM